MGTTTDERFLVPDEYAARDADSDVLVAQARRAAYRLHHLFSIASAYGVEARLSLAAERASRRLERRLRAQAWWGQGVRVG